MSKRQKEAWEVLQDRVHTEIFYGGGAGGGKSYLGCMWALHNCLRYEGCRGLMGRSKLKELHLIHLSDRNSDPELFKRECQKICGVPTYIS